MQFKVHGAVSYDGFHGRHFSMLPDEALEALAIIFEASEAIGFVPRSARRIVVALIPKPKGGLRPISIFTSFFRLWSRCRSEYRRQWCSEHDRAYFANATGNGVEDTVWRQALQNERAAEGERPRRCCGTLRRSMRPSV